MITIIMVIKMIIVMLIVTVRISFYEEFTRPAETRLAQNTLHYLNVS